MFKLMVRQKKIISYDTTLYKNLMPCNLKLLTLLDGVFFTLIFDGGRGVNLSIPFLSVKTIELAVRLCAALIKTNVKYS